MAHEDPKSHPTDNAEKDGKTAGDVREVVPQGPKAREIYIRDLHLDAIKVKGRDFR